MSGMAKHGILGLWYFRLKKLEILPLPCLLEFGHFSIFRKKLISKNALFSHTNTNTPDKSATLLQLFEVGNTIWCKSVFSLSLLLIYGCQFFPPFCDILNYQLMVCIHFITITIPILIGFFFHFRKDGDAHQTFHAGYFCSVVWVFQRIQTWSLQRYGCCQKDVASLNNVLLSKRLLVNNNDLETFFTMMSCNHIFQWVYHQQSACTSVYFRPEGKDGS